MYMSSPPSIAEGELSMSSSIATSPMLDTSTAVVTSRSEVEYQRAHSKSRGNGYPAPASRLVSEAPSTHPLS
jgi:hypothetical protein